MILAACLQYAHILKGESLSLYLAVDCLLAK